MDRTATSNRIKSNKVFVEGGRGNKQARIYKGLFISTAGRRGSQAKLCLRPVRSKSRLAGEGELQEHNSRNSGQCRGVGTTGGLYIESAL